MDIHQVLKQFWGYDEFRPRQEEIIRSVLDGKDTLALLPTGGGKSICFQVPALSRPGICLVVSPLIALMKDQVENLRKRGIRAIAIISGMGKREIDILLDNCIYGDVKFLYISPERLLSDLVRERIRHMNVSLIAVDEAHCISQWGYDFRPPYLQLPQLRQIHPRVPVLALTASATRQVAEDIQDKLGFRERNVFRSSFERRNLRYVVFNEADKSAKLLSISRNVHGSGIVYVRNRRATQEAAYLLNRHGISSDFYHAGLDLATRNKRQEDWKNGRTRVMVATNAFGMGIDKPDVRFVVHLDLPDSLESYYQEAGRAGRDEAKSFAVLLYQDQDVQQLQKKLEDSYPAIEEIKAVYHYLGNYYQLAYGAGEGLVLPFDAGDFCRRYKLEALKTLQALKFLEMDGYIAISDPVYLPARVQVLMSPEDLYRFQIEHQEYDLFIKTMMRTYGGLYDHYIPVKEKELARRLQTGKERVTAILERLHQLQVISFMPQTDKPQLQFLRGRADSQHVVLNRKFIAERQKIHSDQVASVIRYAATRECRNQLLLTYFDEADPRECGVCDVCLERKRSADQPATE